MSDQLQIFVFRKKLLTNIYDITIAYSVDDAAHQLIYVYRNNIAVKNNQDKLICELETGFGFKFIDP